MTTAAVLSPDQSTIVSENRSPLTTGPTGRLPVGVGQVPIDWVGTLGGGRTLVLGYTGDSCEQDQRALVTETATTVGVTVLVNQRPAPAEPSGPRSGTYYAACLGIATYPTLTVQLPHSVGNRRLVDGSRSAAGAVLRPFDGSSLLQPSWLPAHFALAYQGGNRSGTLWGRSWALPVRTARASVGSIRCVPGPEAVTIEQGLGTVAPVGPTSTTLADRPLVNGVPATVTREVDNDTLTLTWTPKPPFMGSVRVSSVSQCGGDTPMPLSTLLRIARGLK